MKVNFLIAGVQKSGTSALDRYLRFHEEITMAVVKETHFFDNEELFTHSQIDYSPYHALFTDTPGKILGEATPIYTWWYPALERIWKYNPAIKLIIVLRNPIDRAYSHWNMERSRSAESLHFSQAIRTEIERCYVTRPLQHRVFSYTDRGFYSEQLRRVWRFFPKEQCLILKFDKIKQDVNNSLRQITDFLEIQPFPPQPYLDTHSTPYTAPMAATDRSFLENLFFHEIRSLEALLDWDCSDWL